MADMRKPPLNASPARHWVAYQRFRVFAKSVNNRFRALRRKVSDIAVTLDPLVDHVAHAERELQDHDERLTRLERRQAPQRTRRTAA